MNDMLTPTSFFEGSHINSFQADGDAELPELLLTSPVTVSGGDAGIEEPYLLYAEAEPSEYLAVIAQNSEVLVASNQRIEAQNEASISILLIIIVVGMLNYVYKFFKIFF